MQEAYNLFAQPPSLSIAIEHVGRAVHANSLRVVSSRAGCHVYAS